MTHNEGNENTAKPLTLVYVESVQQSLKDVYYFATH